MVMMMSVVNSTSSVTTATTTHHTIHHVVLVHSVATTTRLTGQSLAYHRGSLAVMGTKMVVKFFSLSLNEFKEFSIEKL